MAGVLICVQPAQGHVQPTLPAVRALVGAGHRVRVLTGRRYGDRFAQAGATWLPLPEAVDFDDTDLDASLPGRSGLRGIALARFDLSSFVRAVPAQAAAVDRALADEPASVIVCDPLFLGCVPMLTRDPGGSGRTRPAVLQLGFLPLLLPGADTSPRDGSVGSRLAAAARGRLERSVEAAVFAPAQRLAEQTVPDAGGGPLRVPFLTWGRLSDGVLQLTCPGFEYPRPAGGPPIHFLGPLSTGGTTGHAPDLPPWWADILASERPVVHVTQGTIATADPGELIVPTLRALADEPVTVVVSTGGASTAGLELPPNARAASWLPYDELLPRTSVMITNGGYGGVQFALRHGVPLVVFGVSEDKPAVAARVRWSGTGIGVARRRATQRRVGRAVRRVLADPSYAARARELAAEIAACPGVEGLVRLVERYADPATPTADRRS